MSLISDLNKILGIKVDIYNSIKYKGVDIATDTPLDDYNEAIESISGGTGNEDTDFSALLVLEGIVTGFEPSKTQLENETAAILRAI